MKESSSTNKIHDSQVAPHFKSFEEFYPFYLTQHSKPLTKLLHFIGTGLGLIVWFHFMATLIVYIMKAATYADTECQFALEILTWKFGQTVNFSEILYGLVCGYGFAWISHFFIE